MRSAVANHELAARGVHSARRSFAPVSPWPAFTARRIAELMGNVPRSPFAPRDFRLLWVGKAVSALGDQFALVALPWLARLLTGSRGVTAH
jgi:hypothetical protein